jgi:DNA-binding NarL/FixJ family response regulator
MVPAAAPLASADEPVRYVVIDDEPRYRQDPGAHDGPTIVLAGGYGTVEDFMAIHRDPCHVVVLDLCLNRQTGDKAVLQGVLAIRELTGRFSQRVLVHTADERPEPVARCVAAGAAGFVSKYDDPRALAQAVNEVGRHGTVVSECLHEALRALAAGCRDVRLSDTLEETLTLLDRGMSDIEIARERQMSPRTIEDHKRKILEIFGADMETRRIGFAGLTRELGIKHGDLVNDPAGNRLGRGLIARAMPLARRSQDKPNRQPDTGRNGTWLQATREHPVSTHRPGSARHQQPSHPGLRLPVPPPRRPWLTRSKIGSVS